MTNKDVIMAIMANCNKMRQDMLKEGAPDIEAYRQIEAIETFCLGELTGERMLTETIERTETLELDMDELADRITERIVKSQALGKGLDALIRPNTDCSELDQAVENL